MKIRHTLALSAALSAFTTPAFAQDAATQDEVPPAIDASEIVVTAVARGQNVLDSSVSVSSLNSEAIVDLAPRSSAELIRQIPGIRSESSGGEGNANIAVRGLPVASGGAKFLQLQEDGLPILEFGDITFGNADIFLRTDYSVARVEAVRGGSASTFASNSPGGVVNFISKTGTREGGSLGLTAGLDYREFRADFDYGGSIDADTTFHIGGFSHIGDGPRDVGYDGARGGQIKANITRNFANGYVRVYGKYLNDHSVAYLPNPVLVSGSDADPTYTSIANFSINSDSLHSPNFRPITTLDQANQVETHNINEGMHPKVLAAGGKVATVLDVTDVYMTIFLPTAQAGKVRVGSEARIVLDALPDYVVPAEVSFVAAEAQFTPKSVETRSEREKLMFRVRIRIDPELLKAYRDRVKTGVPGEAYVRLDEGQPWPESLKVALPND